MQVNTSSSETNIQSCISGSVSGRIRRLKGFQRHHHVPDAQMESTEDFVRRIGSVDVKARADALYNDIREAFGYKRREFDYECGEGLAEIRTPDFDVQIRIDQSEDDPKSYRLSTELMALHNDAVAQNPALHACFNQHCDVLTVYFPAGIDVEEKIDRIEDNEALAGCLSYEPDGSQFELKLPDLDLFIQVDSGSIRFQLLTLKNLSKLLERSQQAFDILTKCGFELRLTGG